MYKVSLAVKSAVRAQIKKAGMRVAGDFWKVLDERIQREIERAVGKAKAEGRKTVRAADLAS